MRRLGDRERKLLLGLLVVVAGALLVRLVTALSSGGEATVTAAGGTATAGGENGRDVVALDTSALQPKSNQFPVGRDPFRFAPEPTPPPLPPPKPAPTPYLLVGPTIPPPPPKPQPPDPSHLKFLGSFGPEGNRIAVVMSNGEIYNVRQGAVLEGQFIVQEIGYESVAIAFVNFPDFPPRRIPIGAPGNAGARPGINTGR